MYVCVCVCSFRLSLHTIVRACVQIEDCLSRNHLSSAPFSLLSFSFSSHFAHQKTFLTIGRHYKSSSAIEAIAVAIASQFSQHYTLYGTDVVSLLSFPLAA